MYNIKKTVDEYGSEYAAAYYVAKEARRRAEAYDNRILHSEAIDWVMSGNCPKSILQARQRSYDKIIFEKLSMIKDQNIKISVSISVACSLQSHHLIYIYKNVSDKYQQSRVRVLTKKLYYELLSE